MRRFAMQRSIYSVVVVGGGNCASPNSKRMELTVVDSRGSIVCVSGRALEGNQLRALKIQSSGVENLGCHDNRLCETTNSWTLLFVLPLSRYAGLRVCLWRQYFLSSLGITPKQD